MPKLIKKINLFLFPLTILFFLLEFKLSQIPTYYSLKKNSLESQLGKIEFLSVGSSHGNSINPDFFDKNGFNLSNDAQDIYYDVQLIKKYIDYMPKLRLIIVPISYWSLEYRLDQSIWANRSSFYKFTYDIPPHDFWRRLMLGYYSYTVTYGWTKVVNFIMNNFKSEITRPVSMNGWRDTGYSFIQESREEKRKGQQDPGIDEQLLMNPRFLDENILLIQDLIELCNKRQVSVLLITTPVFHYYYESINPSNYSKWQANIEKITSQNNIQYFNFLDSKLFKAEDFYSEDHLNNLGAEKFSRIMNKIVNSILVN